MLRAMKRHSEIRVAVVGASPKPERYSNQAVRLLADKGFAVVPVTPRGGEIEGWPAVRSLEEIETPVDTVTLYVGPQRSGGLLEPLRRLAPRRVIFNPGTESPPLEEALQAAGIAVERACTLVLLRLGTFLEEGAEPASS